jgi:Na+:H+ antiporter, NhaA family
MPELSSGAPRSTVVDRVVLPIQEFINTEVASGAVLLLAAAIAIAFANSPWDDNYADLWETRVTIDAGVFRIEEDLRHWINDALMTFFFFVVGLEIKRELFRGELRGLKRAALPGISAIGGMLVPALIYTAFNAGGDGGKGWGIPMATDIAFALGILALLGRRIPPQLRVFLLALAIVDDIGAILVIAIFYSGSVQVDSLALAICFIGLIYTMYRLGVQSIPVYFVVGAFVWVAVFESGVHATIAGVALGLITPLDRVRVTIGERVGSVLNRLRTTDGRAQTGHVHPVEADQSKGGPLYQLEHMIHPYTSFVVVPLFALANAGISLDPGTIDNSMTSSVTLGIALGLLVGKPLGIVLFAWLSIRLGASSLPQGATWGEMLGLGMLAGVGFTVALFVNELAFDSEALVERGKLGILAGSLAAGLLGFVLIRVLSGGPQRTNAQGADAPSD